MIAGRSVADLRNSLADQLGQQALVTDLGWREAFAAVPREVFVPFYFQPCRGRPGWRLVEGGQEWREGVYADDALVTQINGSDDAVAAARRGETVEGTPTSSSSAPSLMAAMLTVLEMQEGHRVLEIGTGTGYNAALLGYRLGDPNITTIEVDPALSRRARQALATAGHHPRVVCGDGAAGVAQAVPYDRVISTVALSRVPPAWLEQTREGALILIPLSFAGHGGLMALLSRDATGGASGRLLSQYGGFMAVRATPTPTPPKIRPHLLETSRPTDVPPEALNDGHPASFYLSLRTRPYQVIQFIPDDDSATVQTWGQGADGSTFALTRTQGLTQAAASGPLWDALEAAYTEWRELGRPERDRFGVTAGQQQWVWLDQPDHVIAELAE
ncbi:MAG: methyltransferase domain-containing protein [Pseudonocardiaceae bacterium]